MREVPAVKQWFGRTKRRIGYYEVRSRLREPRFRRCLRPTDVFLVGHPKSGNTWLAYMLALLTHGDGAHEVSLYSVGDFVPFVHGNDYAIEQYEHLSDPRVFRNEYPLHRRLYPRILYILRDPRSVLVSFWHMYRVMFDDDGMTLSSFVDQYLRHRGIFSYWNKHLVRWDRQVRQALSEVQNGRRIHLVRYEDLVSNRRGTLEGVARFIDLPTGDTRFARAVERGSFEAMRETEDRFGAEAYTGRARGTGRFVRKGEVEGWRREMDEAISERLQQEFGPVMAEAGYL